MVMDPTMIHFIFSVPGPAKAAEYPHPGVQICRGDKEELSVLPEILALLCSLLWVLRSPRLRGCSLLVHGDDGRHLRL